MAETTGTDLYPTWGSPEHAAAVTKDRYPAICDALQWLTFTHLPEALRRYSVPFYDAAVDIIGAITTDVPELTAALTGLIAAKDAAVRAGIRFDTGRAGPVPRPQTVADPPKFFTTTTTWAKVRKGITDVVDLGESDVDDIINSIANEGIYFHEKEK